MSREALTDFPIHPLLAERWSPRALATRPVESAKLGALFEAARWAASCYNEQPWRFLIAEIGDPNEHAAMLDCLVEPNRAWAVNAPVLVLGTARTTFTRNGNANPHAWHDLGLATAQLTVQAMALGLFVHPMAGILPEQARQTYAIPAGYDVATALAIGYPGEADSLPEGYREGERAPRERQALQDMVFSGSWAKAKAF